MISIIIGVTALIGISWLFTCLARHAEPNWRALTALLIAMIVIAFLTGSMVDRVLAPEPIAIH